MDFNWKLTHQSPSFTADGEKQKPIISLSNKIKIQGVECFRVGLVNQKSPILFLLANNFHEIGCKAIKVVFRYSVARSKVMSCVNSTKQSDCFQLFSTTLHNLVPFGCIFYFKIYIGSSVEGFAFQPVSRSIDWNYINHTDTADFKFIVAGGTKEFRVHKFMLAAHSLVLEEQFRKDRNHCVEKLDLVTSSCMQQFLDFIYTAQLVSAKSYDLLQLASKYKIKTLIRLCERSLDFSSVNHQITLSTHLLQDNDGCTFAKTER